MFSCEDKVFVPNTKTHEGLEVQTDAFYLGTSQHRGPQINATERLVHENRYSKTHI
jgi:hypothetical protein